MTKLREMLKREEGTVLSAYQDHLGYWTLGTGRLIDKRKGGGITAAEADYLLDNDISKYTAAVEQALPWARGLDEARKGVLLAMAFQMGVAGVLGFKNTLEMVRKGNYKGAAAGLLASRWAQQTPARVQRMAKQMETGVWQ